MRRVGEKIIIGDKIEILITKINTNGSQVGLGITAPKNIKIYREEIYKKIQKSKRKLPR